MCVAVADILSLLTNLQKIGKSALDVCASIVTLLRLIIRRSRFYLEEKLVSIFSGISVAELSQFEGSGVFVTTKRK